MTLYQQAAARVNQTPELDDYRSIILYDWPEGDEHWQWVCNAPASEIVEWADAILNDQTSNHVNKLESNQ